MSSLKLEHTESLGRESDVKLESLLNTLDTPKNARSFLQEECDKLRLQSAAICKENKRLKGEIELCLQENLDIEEVLKETKKKLAKCKAKNKDLKIENADLKRAAYSNDEIMVSQLRKRLSNKDVIIKQLQTQIKEIVSKHPRIPDEFEGCDRPRVRTSKLRASREISEDETQLDFDDLRSHKQIAFRVSRTYQQSNGQANGPKLV